MNWLAWLYNIRLGEADRLVRWDLVWEGLGTWWGRALVVVAVAGAVLLPIAFYLREPVRLRAAGRVGFAFLRMVWLAVLALILAQPVIKVVKSTIPSGEVAVLLDVSRSMGVRDVSEAGEPTKGPTRLDAAEGLLLGEKESRRQGLLAALADKHDLALFDFSDALGAEVVRVPKGWDVKEEAAVGGGAGPVTSAVQALRSDGIATDLGGAVTSALNDLRGRQVSAFVVITDGASNTGVDPILAARAAAREFIPVHAVGIGRPRLADAAVSYVFLDEVLFKDDEAVATVGVRTDALDVDELDVEVLVGEDRLAGQRFTVAGGEQTVMVRFKAETPGEVTLRFRIPPHAAEMVTDNNEQVRKVRVIEDKIKVLLVEDEPRWEYRYLREVLRRDRRIDLKTYLSSASRSLMRAGDEFLSSFPKRDSELFVYDLVLLGEVQPSTLGVMGLKLLERFVGEMAGALVVVAGDRHMPWKFRGTLLEEMLPVKTTGGTTSGLREGFHVEITPEGQEEGSILDLGFGKAGNVRAWKDVPPLHWCAEATKAKPFAQVLAVRAGSQAGVREATPLVATSTYGRGGKVVFVGTDELWRMRSRPGPSAYEKAWVQLVQSAAMAHLLGQTKKARIFTDRREYPAGGVVKISARVLDDDFKPVREDRVEVAVLRGEKEISRLFLAGVPDRPGVFTGEWRAGEEGEFEISFVERPESAGKEIVVRAPRLEMDDPAMRTEFLEEFTRAGGGVFVPLSRAGELPQAVRASLRAVEVESKHTLWDSPILALLFALFLGLELLLRKQAELM